MTIHVLVEGPSELAFLDRWVKRLLPEQFIRVHPHQGKGSLPRTIEASPDPKTRGLLDQLPAKLRGFADSLDNDLDAVLVLLDADDEDATKLASTIESVARACSPHLRVGVSVAIEETEAFYLGDLRALERAFPTADMVAARAYVPDSICGTWELFGAVVGDDGGNKVAWAEAMGPHVTTRPAQSRSPSFRALIQELHVLTPAPRAAKKRRPYRHAAKDKTGRDR